MNRSATAKLGEVCTITKGMTGLASATPGIYPLVTTGAERKTCDSYQFDDEAVCLPLVSSTGHGKKTLNYIHYHSGRFALGTILAAIIPKNKEQLLAEFLHRYLLFYKNQLIVPLMKGAANVSLAIKDIAKIKVSVPPVELQKEFILYFNRINEAGIAFQQQVELQSILLAKLRQSILQDAIEGKLTVEWRKNNPVKKGNPEFDAEALLAKIKSEKQKLIAQGEIKKEKELSPIKSSEEPFKLPEGWVWTRMAEITSLVTSGSRNWKNHYATQGIPLIRSQDIKLDRLQFENQVFVDVQGKVEGDRTRVQQGDLLITITGGNVGKCAWLTEKPEEAFVSQHVALMRPVDTSISQHLHKWLTSEKGGRGLLSKYVYGDKPGLNLDQLRQLLIPLPPQAEQKAILSQVGELLSFVDELETQVEERQSQSQELLQAVLREAFGGVKYIDE